MRWTIVKEFKACFIEDKGSILFPDIFEDISPEYGYLGPDQFIKIKKRLRGIKETDSRSAPVSLLPNGNGFDRI